MNLRFPEEGARFQRIVEWMDLRSSEREALFVTVLQQSNPQSLNWKVRSANLPIGRSAKDAVDRRPSYKDEAPLGKTLLVPFGEASITLPAQMRKLVCHMHCPRYEVKVVLETLSGSPQQEVQGLNPAIYPAPRSGWAIALSVNVDADARRISQALTEPEYLEAWISMPDQSEGSSIVATKRTNGYGLDHWRAGRVVTSIVGCFLSCHYRKMRLKWRKVCSPNSAESLVDFRIRGNFGSSVLGLRQTAFISADDYLWHQTLWERSLETLALILRSM